MCHKCGITHFITVRKQAACAVFKVLAHDSVPFHPTSSSSLRRKRKDERKHKKRSVCDCESCTLQNLHNSFDPPSSISSSFAIVSPSTLFRTFIAEGKKRILQNALMKRARWVNTETCSFYFSEQGSKKSLVKGKTD